MAENFIPFRDIIAQRASKIAGYDEVFHVNASKDDIWDIYLAAFPKGTNPMFRERTEHDCSTCRSFVKNVGGMVALDDKGNLQTIWDVAGAPYPYDVVAEKMAEFIRMGDIDRVYRTQERGYGVKQNHEFNEAGVRTHTWNHFFITLPSKLTSQDVGVAMSNAQSARDVLHRGLTELTPDAVELAIDLAEGDLYRGKEHLPALKGFRKLMQAYREFPADNQANFAWLHCNDKSARFRNSAIGTLVQDLSEGMDVEKAVKRFESKVAPHNYKRSSAPITPAMVTKAVGTLRDLGLEGAIHRRHATIKDVSVNDILFADRSIRPAMKDALTDLLMGATKPKKVTPKGTLDVDGETFFKDVLPGAEKVELLLEGKHLSRFVSLTAPEEEDTGSLFKWSNDFAWAYDGDAADSVLTREVAARGGRTDGVIRFSIMWNYGKRNTSLMDAHVFMPGNPRSPDKVYVGGGHSGNHYGNDMRVGWNRRTHPGSGGTQDVDYTEAAPEGVVPVENITFPDLRRMPEGRYIYAVNNWAYRSPTQGGFKCEIAFGGEVFEYEYDKPMKNHEWVTVAEVFLKDGKFTIKHHLTPGSAPVEKWGVTTGRFVPVQTVMLSPNYWGAKGTGNKHHFFILKDCRNPDTVRPFFNEFLREDLYRDHRKVFEVLGQKMKIDPSERQLSGIGLSHTRRDRATFTVQKDGSRRTYNVQF